MDELLARAVEALRAAGWKYHVAGHESSLLLPVEVETCHLTCVLESDEEEGQIVLYVLFPAHVPERRLPAVMEYVTRANTGLRVGAFELDLDEGLVAFRVGFALANYDGIPAVLDPTLRRAAATVERYFISLMRVIFAGVRPIDALEEVERYSLEQVVLYANGMLNN
jgi:hypothetical protein